ncbi:cobalamin adenosyltransferase [Acinetobacter baumannii]|uniref:Heme-binding protein n=1 Tax=Pestalotiopsis fici (strain W106-1 / CGMCC3.15140) TaxID=1229662 RepID=W3WUL3_PESFW|nr:uncharacterized protein PFICI_11943 [Pestalotiopsis fici W106-1]ETS76556.1 hypothetical protein PFICI_11943 [Pestalotiopsis fici W106-1]PSD98349.1 cobalamin adenosyltransferase [Acinetobacter baumannii]
MKVDSVITLAILALGNGAIAALSPADWYKTMKPPNERFVLNAEQAQKAINAAAAVASQNSSPSTIVVLDPAGFVISLLRMDNAWIESVDTCIKKTRSVSLFNGAFTTEELNPIIQPGSEDYGLETANGGLMFVKGAIPLYINGTFFAAIGVCGGSGAQDVEAAIAGVLAVNGTTLT